MKKSFLSFVWFVLLTLSMGVNAKDVVGVEKQVEELRQENTRLKSEFELLTQKVTQESNITDKSFTGISNQLSAASTAASWFSSILAIASIVLAALIAWLSNKTQKAAQKAIEALKETQRLKTDIDDNLRDLNLRLIDDELRDFAEKCIKPAINQNDFSDYQKEISDFLCALLESITLNGHGAHLQSVRVGVYTDLIKLLHDKGYMGKVTPEFLDKNKAWQEAQVQ